MNDAPQPADTESPLLRPMRWMQLTLVADDPGKYDPAFWLDYMKRTHSEGACLSAGGCVAFYPTEVPLHHRSEWLGDMDPFGELVAGCRAMDMVVVARTDPHACHDDVRQAHPDWLAVTADGEPRRHWSHPDYWVTCALGPYNFEFMTEVTREIVARYGVDGIFTNRWDGSGICYCEHCRTNFRAATGMDIPLKRDADDEAWRAHLLWRQERLFELWRLWDGEIRKINPGGRFIPNTGGGAMIGLDMTEIGRLATTLAADRQSRRGVAAPWAAGKNAKEYRSALGDKPVSALFSVGVAEEYRWKDSVQSGAEVRVWVADAIAQGMRPWCCKFSGVLHDRRWLDPVAEIYNWHHANVEYLRNTANLARVGLVYSQQTAFYYAKDSDAARAKVEAATEGVYHALVEGRIPFEMVHDRLLDPEHVGQFKLLILPNIAALSDGQCDQLRAFVAAGGSILATGETSLYDEAGRRREDFGLADLLGVSATGELVGPMKNAYLRLNHPHPVLAGLEDAPRIVHGAYRQPVQATAEFAARPVTHIPAYPDLPMEEVYPRDESDEPELYLREIGTGRVAYFNWDIGRIFWHVLAVDHGKLLANTVRWALNEEPVVTVIGAGVLDLAVWRQERSVTVHMVNLTNPMMMKGPYREIIPSPPQQVRLRLPDGVKAREARLLVAGQKLRAKIADGVVTADIPPILLHEVLAVDLVSER